VTHGYHHEIGVCFHAAGEETAEPESLNLWSANK
jgi:hypothetical protein